jgi:hypothetical protein
MSSSLRPHARPGLRPHAPAFANLYTSTSLSYLGESADVTGMTFGVMGTITYN